MLEIHLSKKSNKGYPSGDYTVLISDCDADLMDIRWAIVGTGKYVVHNHKHKTTYIHRIVLERILGRPLEKGECVDHINRNPFDNRRENLRVATYRQNVQNSVKPNKLGYRGVTKTKQKEPKFTAKIRYNGERIELGVFDTPEEAYDAYCRAAIEYHGEFANLECKKGGIKK